MNNQQICPEDRKVIWCDKDRCRWRAGLCPPFRGSVCPFGGRDNYIPDGISVCRCRNRQAIWEESEDASKIRLHEPLH